MFRLGIFEGAALGEVWAADTDALKLLGPELFCGVLLVPELHEERERQNKLRKTGKLLFSIEDLGGSLVQICNQGCAVNSPLFLDPFCPALSGVSIFLTRARPACQRYFYSFIMGGASQGRTLGLHTVGGQGKGA
jgi:hypothetical protein